MEVCFVGMISSNFIYLGGLKKWVPKKCSLKSFPHSSPISVIGNPEVFELTIVSGFRTFSILDIISFLISILSMITSQIQSASLSRLKSSSKFPSLIRSANSGNPKGAGFIFRICLMLSSAVLLGRFGSSLFKSNKITSSPALIQ